MPNVDLNAAFRGLRDRLEAQGLIAEAEYCTEPNGKGGEPLFHLILSGLQEVYDVPCLIAGGAVRDLAAGITKHKDVDVFIPIPWAAFKERREELGWRLIPTLVKKTTAYSKKQPNTPGMMGFKTLARATGNVQGTVVDLVFMDKPLTQQDVDTFPVFAQRGIWTLEEGLKLSPQAKQDVENKTFTVDPTITDKVRLQHILEKIKGWQQRADYKDWKIVEPDIKEWWEVKEEDAKPKASVENSWEDYKKYMLNDANFLEGQKWIKVLG